MLNPQIEREFIERRINVVFWIVTAFFVICFIGFWYLQVIRGHYYSQLAKENIRKEYTLPAPRGLILDRNNEILAENRLSHNLFITPRMSKNLENTLLFLSNVLVTSPEELKKAIQKEGTLKSVRSVLIYQDLSLSQLAYISARKVEYPELEIKQETKRSYKYDALFAQTIGYVGGITEEQERGNEFPNATRGSTVGQDGLERYYNSYLMGKNGYEKKVVNSHGLELKEFRPDKKPPEPGRILRTGFDLELQRVVYEAFEEKNENGAAVALDIKTGEVLLLYSKPYFNPNDFIPRMSHAKWKELISDPGNPLQNRPIHNKFAPGSTFKIVMALAGLQEKKITPDTRVACGGSFFFDRAFRCWKPGGHGVVNLHQAIVHSCDVYFYTLGARLDIDMIAKYARLLGLGSSTEIDLPHEAKGLVPSRQWKLSATRGVPWYQGETISVAIGQGPILVTTLQMASLTATVASGGMKIQPHLLNAVLNLDGKVVDVARYKKDRIEGIDAQHYEVIKKALWGVVNESGTGTKARLAGYDVCGKTGTVQVVGYDRGGDLSKRRKEEFGDHAWFLAFAPYSDPQIAVAIFVEHGGHGSDAAAPVAKKILETYFESRNIPPQIREADVPARLSAQLAEPGGQRRPLPEGNSQQ